MCCLDQHTQMIHLYSKSDNILHHGTQRLLPDAIWAKYDCIQGNDVTAFWQCIAIAITITLVLVIIRSTSSSHGTSSDSTICSGVFPVRRSPIIFLHTSALAIAFVATPLARLASGASVCSAARRFLMPSPPVLASALEPLDSDSSFFAAFAACLTARQTSARFFGH